MKTIGIIGGVGWPSTLEYYRRINEGVGARLGGSHAAEIALYSFDYARMAKLMQEQKWNEIGGVAGGGSQPAGNLGRGRAADRV